MYLNGDEEKSNKIKEINEKISKEQKQVFDILLKISKSFSDEKITKEERNELFKEVDSLKKKIKDYNNELKQIHINAETKKDKSKKEIETETEKHLDTNKNIDDKYENENKIEIESTIDELESSLKEFEKTRLIDKLNKSRNNNQNSIHTLDTDTQVDEFDNFGRKKSRTQLVVVEDNDSLSGKIKGFFNKLRGMIK